MKILTRNHIAIFCVILACIIAGALYGPDVVSHVRLRSEMANEIHPVWREFDSGQLRMGSDLSILTKSHPPSEQFEIGPYSGLLYFQNYDSAEPALYFSGLNVTAKNGILVRASAYSCTWNKVFFDTLTQADELEMQQLLAESDPTRKTEQAEALKP